MRIVFDIDDTITFEQEFIRKFAPEFIKRKYELDATVLNNCVDCQH